MADPPHIPSPDIQAAVQRQLSGARDVRLRRRTRLRPTMGATGSYFERLQLEIDGQRVPAVLKWGSMPVGPQTREAMFFARHSTSVPIRTPGCYAVGPLADSDTWIVMSRLPRGKRLVDWTPDDVRASLRNLARLHGRFLGAAPSDLPRPFSAELDYSLSFVREGVRGLRSVFDEFPGLPRFASDRALEILMELANRPNVFRHAFARSPETLLHGDYHRGNLIARDGEEQIAFDWQFACAGPPAYDLAVFWHYLGVVNKPFFFRFIDRADVQDRSIAWSDVEDIYSEALAAVRPDADLTAIFSCAEEALAWEVVRQVTYMAAGMTQTHGGAFRFAYRDHRTLGRLVTRLVGIDRLWVVYQQLFADFEERAQKLIA